MPISVTADAVSLEAAKFRTEAHTEKPNRTHLGATGLSILRQVHTLTIS
jgi:hypothetical protein